MKFTLSIEIRLETMENTMLFKDRTETLHQKNKSIGFKQQSLPFSSETVPLHATQCQTLVRDALLVGMLVSGHDIEE